MSQVIWLSLAWSIKDGHGPLHPVVRREIRLLSEQLHLRKEDAGREKVIRDQRGAGDLGACRHSNSTWFMLMDPEHSE